MENSKPVIGCSYSDSKNEFSIIIVGQVIEGVFNILDQSQMYCSVGDDRKPDSEFRKKIAELSKKWNAEILDTKKSFRHLEERLETKNKIKNERYFNKRSK